MIHIAGYYIVLNNVTYVTPIEKDANDVYSFSIHFTSGMRPLSFYNLEKEKVEDLQSRFINQLDDLQFVI